MKTRVQKWGNSLALRIPKAFAAEVGIDDNAWVDISLVDGKLVLMPLPESILTLDDLLAGITDTNIHAEYDTGLADGNEVW
jgi:antitoxin MazE